MKITYNDYNIVKPVSAFSKEFGTLPIHYSTMFHVRNILFCDKPDGKNTFFPGGADIKRIHAFFYKKPFYKKLVLKMPKC